MTRTVQKRTSVHWPDFTSVIAYLAFTVVVIGLLFLCGCAIQRGDTLIAVGSYIQSSDFTDTDKTHFKSLAVSGLGTNVNRGAGDLDYKWDGKGSGAIKTGQSANGIDTSNQVEITKVATQAAVAAFLQYMTGGIPR